MWGKRPLIPKSIEVQDKYRHEYVLSRINDEGVHARLRITIAILFSVTVLLLGFLFLHYALALFSRAFWLIILGLLGLALLVLVAWVLGVKVAQKAQAMRIARYYQLYVEYAQQLEIVQEARERLMRAESDLAKRERELDHLIEQGSTLSPLPAALSAISTVLLQRHSYAPTTSKVDVTDHVVRQHEEQGDTSSLKTTTEDDEDKEH